MYIKTKERHSSWILCSWTRNRKRSSPGGAKEGRMEHCEDGVEVSIVMGITVCILHRPVELDIQWVSGKHCRDWGFRAPPKVGGQ